MKLVSMAAGAFAYHQLTSGQDGSDKDAKAESSQKNPELQRVTSGLAEAARGALTASATKGVEALNQNLQDRSAALRAENQQSEQADDRAQDAGDEQTQDEATGQTDDTGADATGSEDGKSDQSSKSGGR